MKNQEYVELTIKFKKSTFKEINEYVQYQNLRNDKAKREGKPIDLNTDDFITGCVNAYLNKLKKLNFKNKVNNFIFNFIILKQLNLNLYQF